MILPMVPQGGQRARTQGKRSQKGPPSALSLAAEAKVGRGRRSETGCQDWNSARKEQVRGRTLTDTDWRGLGPKEKPVTNEALRLCIGPSIELSETICRDPSRCAPASSTWGRPNVGWTCTSGYPRHRKRSCRARSTSLITILWRKQRKWYPKLAAHY